MQDQVDALLQEIAVKHGIALSRDDPILILQTINERLLHASALAQQTQLDRFKEELEALAWQWRLDAKDKAERIVNASLAASTETARQLIQEMVSVTISSMQAQIDGVLDRALQRMTPTRVAPWINLVASCVALVAAAVVAWTVTR